MSIERPPIPAEGFFSQQISCSSWFSEPGRSHSRQSSFSLLPSSYSNLRKTAFQGVRRNNQNRRHRATTTAAHRPLDAATGTFLQHSSASAASGKALSEFLQLRQTYRHRCKLRLCVLLLPRIGRQFARMDALLLNAEFVLRDNAVELIDKQFISPGH